MTTENPNTTAQASEPTRHTVNSAADALLSLLPDEGQEGEEAQTETEQPEGEEPEGEAESSEETGEESADEENPEGEEEPLEEEQTPAKIRVKADGEEIEVTLDELKNGYSRTKDYTKKTQEIAEQRKKLEGEFQAVSQERQHYAQILEKLAQQAEQGAGQEPDWDYLRQTDPIEYSVQYAEWMRHQQKRQAIEQEQGRLQQLQQQEMIERVKERLEQEKTALTAIIPEWKDAKKAKEDKALILAQGKKLGFSDKELDQIYDHRAVVALRKAALYDQLMDKRVAAKPVIAPQKTLPAGNKSQRILSDSKRLTQTAIKTGNVRDAAAAIESLL